MPYITAEVEVWIDEWDIEHPNCIYREDFRDLFDAFEALHDEHHGGVLQWCPYPACTLAREAIFTYREEQR